MWMRYRRRWFLTTQTRMLNLMTILRKNKIIKFDYLSSLR